MKTDATVQKGRKFQYGRCSSKPQVTGDSFRRQDVAKRDAFTYVDEGVSAWKGKNHKQGKLGELLKLAAAGDEIVINDYSRWSRQHPMDSLGELRSVVDRGVKVTFSAGGMSITTANFKPMFPMLAMLAQMANAESDELSRKIKSAYAGRAEKMKEEGHIKFGRLPAWLKWDSKPKTPGRKPVEIPEKVALVKKVFSLCIEGHGCTMIERKMREHPALGNSKRAEWNVRFVWRLLRDRCVLGFHPSSGEKQVYPQIISDDDFRTAQARLADRKTYTVATKHESRNLFTGMLFCARCGGPLAKHSVKSRGHGYSQLFCSNKIRGKKGGENCHGCARYDRLEARALALLLEQGKALRASMTQATPSPASALQAELDGIYAESNKIERLIDGMERPPKRLAERLVVLEAREADVKAKLEVEKARMKVQRPASVALGQFQVEFAMHLDDPAYRLKIRLALREIIERVNIDLSTKQAALVLKDSPKSVNIDMVDELEVVYQ
jgi:DNA invertase Pin-like site-specific DNA recombinase